MRAGLLPLLLAAACALPGKRSRTVESTPEEARAATNARNWSLAAERWYSIFRADPQRGAEACAMAARAMLEMRDAEQASRVLDLGLRSHPEDVVLLELKGRSLATLGFARAAADCFERVLEQREEHADVWLRLAEVRMQLGLETGAVKAFERALALGHEDATTWAGLGRARKRSGDPEGALDAFTRAFELAPGSEPDLLEAAQLCLDPGVKAQRARRLELGLEWLARIVEREPNRVGPHFQLGVLAEELERGDEAVQHYLRAIELDPACLEALRNLALLYAARGDEAGKRKLAGMALQHEQDPDRRAALRQLLEGPVDTQPPAAEPAGGARR